ncbi:MAG: hypothetical protein GF404_13235 [candidate division Zixibacteria bacterium]|nr:hypothetical protein [candidate division Zixibacteria bacterium]
MIFRVGLNCIRAGMAVFLLSAFSGCGGTSEKEADKDDARKTRAVPAVELKYHIKLDNLPLMGPQTETGKLTVSSEVARYHGSAEVVMGDDRSTVKRTEILDFRDFSLSLLQASDSTYETKFYDKRDLPVDSALKSSLAVELTEEYMQIDEFQNCRKIVIEDRAEKPKKSGRLDRGTYINGEIWIISDIEASGILEGYHHRLAALYGGSEFEGLALWRILRRLNVDRPDLQRILLNLEGAVVRAEFLVETVTMNKKARITVSLNLDELLEKKINPAVFDIPEYYRVKF